MTALTSSSTTIAASASSSSSLSQEHSSHSHHMSQINQSEEELQQQEQQEKDEECDNCHKKEQRWATKKSAAELQLRRFSHSNANSENVVNSISHEEDKISNGNNSNSNNNDNVASLSNLVGNVEQLHPSLQTQQLRKALKEECEEEEMSKYVKYHCNNNNTNVKEDTTSHKRQRSNNLQHSDKHNNYYYNNNNDNSHNNSNIKCKTNTEWACSTMGEINTSSPPSSSWLQKEYEQLVRLRENNNTNNNSNNKSIDSYSSNNNNYLYNDITRMEEKKHVKRTIPTVSELQDGFDVLSGEVSRVMHSARPPTAPSTFLEYYKNEKASFAKNNVHTTNNNTCNNYCENEYNKHHHYKLISPCYKDDRCSIDEATRNNIHNAREHHLNELDHGVCSVDTQKMKEVNKGDTIAEDLEALSTIKEDHYTSSVNPFTIHHIHNTTPNSTNVNNQIAFLSSSSSLESLQILEQEEEEEKLPKLEEKEISENEKEKEEKWEKQKEYKHNKASLAKDIDYHNNNSNKNSNSNLTNSVNNSHNRTITSARQATSRISAQNERQTRLGARSAEIRSARMTALATTTTLLQNTSTNCELNNDCNNIITQIESNSRTSNSNNNNAANAVLSTSPKLGSSRRLASHLPRVGTAPAIVASSLETALRFLHDKEKETATLHHNNSYNNGDKSNQNKKNKNRNNIKNGCNVQSSNSARMRDVDTIYNTFLTSTDVTISNKKGNIAQTDEELHKQNKEELVKWQNEEEQQEEEQNDTTTISGNVTSGNKTREHVQQWKDLERLAEEDAFAKHLKLIKHNRVSVTNTPEDASKITRVVETDSFTNNNNNNNDYVTNNNIIHNNNNNSWIEESLSHLSAVGQQSWLHNEYKVNKELEMLKDNMYNDRNDNCMKGVVEHSNSDSYLDNNDSNKMTTLSQHTLNEGNTLHGCTSHRDKVSHKLVPPLPFSRLQALHVTPTSYTISRIQTENFNKNNSNNNKLCKVLSLSPSPTSSSPFHSPHLHDEYSLQSSSISTSRIKNKQIDNSNNNSSRNIFDEEVNTNNNNKLTSKSKKKNKEGKTRSESKSRQRINKNVNVNAEMKSPSHKCADTRDGRIKVIVRKRPLNFEEITNGHVDCVQVEHSSNTIQLSLVKQRVDLTEYTENSSYTFDTVFDQDASNNDLHNNCVKELVQVVLRGGRASCFAYGQTGSGKTYTMMGESNNNSNNNNSNEGLYLLGARELFAQLSPSQHLCVAFYEIYCNNCFDLLNERHPVVIREDALHKVNTCHLTWHKLHHIAHLRELVCAGLEQRRSGSTSANEQSSRSHAILSIRIVCHNKISKSDYKNKNKKKKKSSNSKSNGEEQAMEERELEQEANSISHYCKQNRSGDVNNINNNINNISSKTQELEERHDLETELTEQDPHLSIPILTSYEYVDYNANNNNINNNVNSVITSTPIDTNETKGNMNDVKPQNADNNNDIVSSMISPTQDSNLNFNVSNENISSNDDDGVAAAAADDYCNSIEGGIINYVDLAGSERAADTYNEDKKTRMEGAEINKSLLALKECIRALDEKRRHVPFRGCKLTEVLRDSFSTDSRTIMIATISPSSGNYEHSANTLRYAFRVQGLTFAYVSPSRARNAIRPSERGVQKINVRSTNTNDTNNNDNDNNQRQSMSPRLNSKDEVMSMNSNNDNNNNNNKEDISSAGRKVSSPARLVRRCKSKTRPADSNNNNKENVAVVRTARLVTSTPTPSPVPMLFSEPQLHKKPQEREQSPRLVEKPRWNGATRCTSQPIRTTPDIQIHAATNKLTQAKVDLSVQNKKVLYNNNNNNSKVSCIKTKAKAEGLSGNSGDKSINVITNSPSIESNGKLHNVPQNNISRSILYTGNNNNNNNNTSNSNSYYCNNNSSNNNYVLSASQKAMLELLSDQSELYSVSNGVNEEQSENMVQYKNNYKQTLLQAEQQHLELLQEQEEEEEQRNKQINNNSRSDKKMLDATLSELEHKLRKTIVEQVQRDLSSEIQRVLDERDAVIDVLRKENVQLRRRVNELEKITTFSTHDILTSTLPPRSVNSNNNSSSNNNNKNGKANIETNNNNKVIGNDDDDEDIDFYCYEDDFESNNDNASFTSPESAL